MQKKRVSDTRMASKIKPFEKGQQSAVRVSGCVLGSAFSVLRLSVTVLCLLCACVRASFGKAPRRMRSLSQGLVVG